MNKAGTNNMGMRIGVGYVGLANAIVYNAAMEYKRAIQFNKECEIANLKRFFRSNWYKTLCTIDADYLMRELEKAAVVDKPRGRKIKEKNPKRLKKDQK